MCGRSAHEVLGGPPSGPLSPGVSGCSRASQPGDGEWPRPDLGRQVRPLSTCHSSWRHMSLRAAADHLPEPGATASPRTESTQGSRAQRQRRHHRVPAHSCAWASQFFIYVGHKISSLPFFLAEATLIGGLSHRDPAVQATAIGSPSVTGFDGRGSEPEGTGWGSVWLTCLLSSPSHWILRR